MQELSVNIVEGPDDYLYGEEKALLEVIEGRDPLPRLLPPYELGLFATDSAIGWEAGVRPVSGRAESNPTVVNNVETLASAAHIMANGAEWFRSMGTAESPGTVIATVVGDVVHPGVHEVEMGTPFSALLAAVRWTTAGSAVQGRVLGRFQRGAACRSVRRAADLRRLRGTRFGARCCWLRRCTTTPST